MKTPSPNARETTNSPLRATMFHAVGLKAIEAKEQYKEGFEKSTCFSRANMAVYAVSIGREERKKAIADVAAWFFSFLVSPLASNYLGRQEVPRVKQVEIHSIHEGEKSKYSQLPTTAYTSQSLHVCGRSSVTRSFQISRDSISVQITHMWPTAREHQNTEKKLRNFDNFSLYVPPASRNYDGYSKHPTVLRG